MTHPAIGVFAVALTGPPHGVYCPPNSVLICVVLIGLFACPAPVSLIAQQVSCTTIISAWRSGARTTPTWGMSMMGTLVFRLAYSNPWSKCFKLLFRGFRAPHCISVDFCSQNFWIGRHEPFYCRRLFRHQNGIWQQVSSASVFVGRTMPTSCVCCMNCLYGTFYTAAAPYTRNHVVGVVSTCFSC